MILKQKKKAHCWKYSTSKLRVFLGLLIIAVFSVGMIPMVHSTESSQVRGVDAPQYAYYGLGGDQDLNYGNDSDHLYSEIKFDSKSFSGNGDYANYNLHTSQNIFMSGVNRIFGYAVDDPYFIIQSTLTLDPDDRLSDYYTDGTGTVPAEYRWTVKKVTYTISVTNFNNEPVNLNSASEQWEISNHTWNYIAKSVNSEQNFDYGDDTAQFPSNPTADDNAMSSKLVKFALEKGIEFIPYGDKLKTGIDLFKALKDLADNTPNVIVSRPDNYKLKIEFTPPSDYLDYRQAIETLNFAMRVKGANNGEGYQRIHVETDAELSNIYSKYQNGMRFAFKKDYSSSSRLESFSNDYWIGMGTINNYRIIEPVAMVGGSIGINTIANSLVLQHDKFSMSNSLDRKWVAINDNTANLELNPIADPGFRFSHWEDALGNTIISDTEYNDLTINSDGLMSITGQAPFYYPGSAENLLFYLYAVFEPMPIDFEITSPSTGSVVEGEVAIDIMFTQLYYISNITMLVDGAFYERIYLGSSPISEYSFTLITTIFNDGDYDITIIAVSITGASDTETISLVFENTVTPPPPPPPPPPCGGYYSDDLSLDMPCSW